jgi:hypothetical protein
MEEVATAVADSVAMEEAVTAVAVSEVVMEVIPVVEVQRDIALQVLEVMVEILEVTCTPVEATETVSFSFCINGYKDNYRELGNSLTVQQNTIRQ